MGRKRARERDVEDRGRLTLTCEPVGLTAPNPGQVAAVQEKLLAWFEVEGSDLPWRRSRDPYAVLVSELMLQQTQRARVIPKYLEFLERFPSVQALAAAPAAAVIRAWSGLGYNRRALALHQIARRVLENGGALPSDREALLALPGIGAYTAGAVACFGFGQGVAFVDTNIRRVLGRVLNGEAFPAVAPKRDKALAAAALPAGRAYEWNSALMDLGARICSARAPRCEVCPLAAECRARPGLRYEATAPLRRVAEIGATYSARSGGSSKQAVSFTASDRYLRGRIVEALRLLQEGEALDLSSLALAATGIELPPQDERVGVLVDRLVREGLVAAAHDGEQTPRYRLPT
jgi:A/G-specific adenine glycosylase